MDTHASASLATASAIVLCLASPSLAQPPATTFRDVQRLVQIGQRLVVTDTSGVVVKGRLEEVSELLIGLQTSDGRREFSPAHVSEIRRQADSVLDGTLWGALIGTGAGLAIGLALDASRGEGTWLAPSITAAGAGGGTLAGWIGDATRPHADLLFKAPPGRAGLLLLPVLSRERIGLQVALQF
jgi:hypothetical protein